MLLMNQENVTSLDLSAGWSALSYEPGDPGGPSQSSASWRHSSASPALNGFDATRYLAL